MVLQQYLIPQCCNFVTAINSGFRKRPWNASSASWKITYYFSFQFKTLLHIVLTCHIKMLIKQIVACGCNMIKCGKVQGVPNIVAFRCESSFANFCSQLRVGASFVIIGIQTSSSGFDPNYTLLSKKKRTGRVLESVWWNYLILTTLTSGVPVNTLKQAGLRRAASCRRSASYFMSLRFGVRMQLINTGEGPAPETHTDQFLAFWRWKALWSLQW